MKWILVSFISFWTMKSSHFETRAASVQQQLSVSGTEWTLVAISGDTSWSHLPDRIPFISFDSEQKRVSGYAGCNRFFGNYTRAGNDISFSPLASTKMYCQESQPTEYALLEALQRADRIMISENQLRLFTGSVELLLFEKRPKV